MSISEAMNEMAGWIKTNITQPIVDRVWPIMQGVYNRTKPYRAYIVATVAGFVAIWNHTADFIHKQVVKLLPLYGQMTHPVDKTDIHALLQQEKMADNLQIIGYFFPLDHALSLVAVMSALCLVALTYRTVKSWIPGLS